MTSDPWGLDVPPHWGEIPRIVPGVNKRIARYRLALERTPPLGDGFPLWLKPGEIYDGYVQAEGPLESLVVLLQSGGDERVEVLGSWVELVAG